MKYIKTLLVKLLGYIQRYLGALKPLVRWLMPLICQGSKLSLGRVAFIVLFVKVVLCYPAMPGEVVTLLLGLLAYNGFSKHKRPADEPQVEPEP